MNPEISPIRKQALKIIEAAKALKDFEQGSAAYGLGSLSVGRSGGSG